MKNLIAVMLFFTGGITHANQSAADIQSLLDDRKFQNTIGEEEITSITNNGQRKYGVVYGSCSVEVRVLSNCAPAPGGPCTNEVRFDSASASCLP